MPTCEITGEAGSFLTAYEGVILYKLILYYFPYYRRLGQDLYRVELPLILGTFDSLCRSQSFLPENKRQL